MATIKFSVLIPVFNRADLIEQTIDSVLSQTFTDYEIIVIDDGSTDQTSEILEKYGSRIQVLSQSNQGPEAARINGIQTAQGEYCVFLDSDDLFLPHTLATYDVIVRTQNRPAVLLGAMVRYPADQITGMWNKLANPENGITIFTYPDFLSKDISINMSNSKIVIRTSVIDTIYQPGKTFEKAFPIDDFNLLMLSGTSGPCIILTEPKTVICRAHQGNTIGDIKFMYRGILSFTAAEWKGRYPGGIQRCLDRYARMSGTIFEYLQIALEQKHYSFALRLFISGWPMILTGILKNKWPWRKKTSPIIISS